MEWLILASSGMFVWSCTAVVDKFVLHNKISSQRFYVLVPALVQFPLTLAFFPLFKPTSFDPAVILTALGAGFIEGIFLYYLFKSISVEELGRVFPLASVSAILTLLGGFILFGETLTQTELFAFVTFVIGGVVLSVKKNIETKSYGFLSVKVFRSLFLGALFISTYTLALRYTFLESDFATGFFFSRIGFLVFGLILLIFWRKELYEQWNKIDAKIRTIVIGNQVFAFGGHALYFSAIALASAALVQSVLAVQGLVVFMIASIVSYLNPNLVAESITRHDLIQKGIGVLLVVLALYLLTL